MNRLRKIEIVFIVFITILSLFLRFYHLAWPNEIISDENYFVNFAKSYLSHNYYHDVHPPFGKFFIALGIRIFGDNAFGWRFFTALFGALLVPLGYFLAKAIFNKIFIAICFSLFILFDGMFFVQSRMARFDVIYLFFVFLTYLLFFSFLKSEKKRDLWLFLSGLFFAFSISTKWVALAAGLSIFIIWLVKKKEIKKPLYWYFFYFILIPLAVYLLVWQIHYGLTSIKPITLYENIKIFTYHEHIKEVHSLESPVWTWPLMLYPFTYYFIKGETVVKQIVDLGNPFIWWPALVGSLFAWWKFRLKDKEINILSIIFFCHFLPFFLIKRSLFLYHFLAAAPFLWLIFIYLLNKSWEKNKRNKYLIATYLFFIIISFLFFYPVYTAQAFSFNALKWRWWLVSWFPFLLR